MQAMYLILRSLWIGALILILFTSACNLPAQVPSTPVGTIPREEQFTPTPLPTTTLAIDTPTALIPVTGAEAVSLQCQFCVNDEPHAVLILPEHLSFLVSDPVVGINCITTQIVNGRRILFCRGAQQTAFTLNVCADNTNCSQFSVTLGNCPIDPQTGPGSPLATVTPRTTPVVLPTNTTIQPTLSPSTSTPAPTQTVISPPTAAVTTPTPLPTPTSTPVVTTIAPSTTRMPRSGRHEPEGFARWYFEAVWRERNYQDIWENYLTPSFKTHASTGNFEDYAAWWDSVDHVDVHSVDVIENDGTHAWIRVTLTFYMKDGRSITNQQYDYSLIFDPARQTWMFDYRT